jgi:hypothetical protein
MKISHLLLRDLVLLWLGAAMLLLIGVAALTSTCYLLLNAPTANLLEMTDDSAEYKYNRGTLASIMICLTPVISLRCAS